VLLIRLLDSLLGLSLVVVVLVGLSADTHWMPWLLSIGSFVGGLLCRQLLLRPAAQTQEPARVEVPA
jgi:hypothetical protein